MQWKFLSPNFRGSKPEIEHLKKAQGLNLQYMFWILSIHVQSKDVYNWVTLYKAGNKLLSLLQNVE